MQDRAAGILALSEARKDISLEELRIALAEVGLTASVARLHRHFARRGMTRKKAGHAIEQDRPDILKQRKR